MFNRRKPEDGKAAPPAPAAAPKPASVTDAPRPADRPDTGLGVPPFRTPPKEAAMGRTPFPTATPPSQPNAGTIPPAPGQQPGQAMGQAPGLQPRPGMQPPQRPRETAERRTLVVGRGISVQGTVTEAERLVVEGTVEASMIHATELSIALGGVFRGEVEVEDAEIAGTIDGTLLARGSLVVRATGKVLGTARCRRLQVEDGGQITGRIEMLAEGAKETPRADASSSAPVEPKA